MMQRLTGKTATTHGLRASFRSWCEDVGVEHEVAEACLAPRQGRPDGAALQSRRDGRPAPRSDALWADHLDPKEPDANVVSIDSARGGRELRP
jgi:hypothetical protein